MNNFFSDYLVASLRVDQLVSGLAINLVASGITSFLARLIFNGSTQRLPGIEASIIPGFSKIPIIGKLLFQQDIFVYLLLLLIILTTYILYYTNFGLTLRAVGEYPPAVDTAGLSVSSVRYCAVIIGGCLASLGGAYLTLVQIRFFAEGMSAGKGFIAIAALIFGKWHPFGFFIIWCYRSFTTANSSFRCEYSLSIFADVALYYRYFGISRISRQIHTPKSIRYSLS